MTKVIVKTDKVANVVKSSNNENKVSFASILDTMIQNCKKDTTLQSIADNCNIVKAKYDNKIKYTVSTIKAHIRYRTVTQKNKLYLTAHNLTVKDNVLKVKQAVKKTVKEEVTEQVTNE